MVVMTEETKRKSQQAKEAAILAGTVMPAHERTASPEKMIIATK